MVNNRVLWALWQKVTSVYPHLSEANFTNNLRAALSLISFCHKTQTLSKENLSKTLLYEKAARKMLVKLTPGVWSTLRRTFWVKSINMWLLSNVIASFFNRLITFIAYSCSFPNFQNILSITENITRLSVSESPEKMNKWRYVVRVYSGANPTNGTL